MNVKRSFVDIDEGQVHYRYKGSFEKGKDADLCIVDVNKPWVVDKNKLKSKSKNTPIENRKLQGQILKTFVKGELAFERN